MLREGDGYMGSHGVGKFVQFKVGEVGSGLWVDGIEEGRGNPGLSRGWGG